MTAIDADLAGFVAHSPGGPDRLELLVRGARCAACMAKIEKAAGAARGVEHARLNFSTGKLSVIFGAGKPEPADVIRAVEAAGYSATLFDPEAAKIRRRASRFWICGARKR